MNTQSDAQSELANLRYNIGKTGYVTEMIVTGIFDKAGWRTFDHSYFLDRDENKGREIDLLAITHHEERNAKKSLTVGLGLSVEIKKATSKPWIVFTSPLTKYEEIENIFDTSLIRLHI